MSTAHHHNGNSSRATPKYQGCATPKYQDNDKGAATVLAAFMLTVLIVLTGGGIRLGSVIVARHRAQSAADLAGLAAAALLPAGPELACHHAEHISTTMGAVMNHCAIDGLDAVIAVTVAVGGWVGATAHARARAGPALQHNAFQI